MSNDLDRLNKIMDYARKLESSLDVSVKISSFERDRLLIDRLIEIRNADVNKTKDTSFINKTIKWFLTNDEFEREVLGKDKNKKG